MALAGRWDRALLNDLGWVLKDGYERSGAKKARELRQSVDSGAGPDEVKGKLAALRDARAKAREQLAQAQAELKEIVTSKQEATLMVMGLLE